MSNARKQKHPPKQPKPRSLPEIEKDHGSLCYKAGQLQYQILIFQEDLRQTNDQLVRLNYEAAERKKLDVAAEIKAASELKPQSETGVADE